MIKHLISLTKLHDFSVLHHRYAISNISNDPKIMRNEQDPGVMLLLKLLDQFQYLSLIIARWRCPPDNS